MQISFNSLPLLFVALLNFLIGASVYRNNPRAGPNRAFGLMAGATSLWTAGTALAHYGPLNLLGAQVSLASASLIPLCAFAFAEVFPTTPQGTLRPSLVILTPFGLFFSGISFSRLILAAVTIEPQGLRITYGPLHSVYAAYVVGGFVGAVFILVRKYRAATGSLRIQIRHLLFALSIPIVVGTATNLLVPLLLHTSELGKYGPFFTLAMIVMVAHAIIRHRLMDIRVVIKRGVVYLTAFTIAGFLLLALIVGSNALVHDSHGVATREIGLALVVAVFFHPLKTRIQQTFDRYLYREPYDYRRTVRQASRALSGTIELSALLGHVARVVDETLRPESVIIYLVDEEEGQVRAAFVSDRASAPAFLPVSTPLLCMAARERKPVFRDDLRQEDAAALDEFARLGCDVVVPLIEESEVIGLFAIGPKRSGDPYFSDDADLLGTLANQSAVAIRNAQIHQQVVQVNEDVQKILSTIDSGVVSVNARGKVTLFNRAAELMTATQAGTLRGQPLQHLPVGLARLIEGTLQDGQPRSQVEMALPDAAGQLVPLLCSTSPLRGPQRTLVGAVAVLSDLSRLKELEQEKRRAERLASLEAIASGMVHEIRNPLVAIKTFTQLLPARFDDAGFRETFARVSDREIARIEDLLGRFRTLSSASSEPMTPLDVSVPLQATLDLLRAQLDERRIRLRYVAAPAPRPILGNASQLEQLFLNLCLNAIEAMEAEGELTLRVADLCEAGGSTLLVEVSDTGSGIPEDLLPAIFNPFVTTKGRGSGLGLAICRSITDAHRATMRARNNVERGCTFTIEFPVPTGHPARVPA